MHPLPPHPAHAHHEGCRISAAAVRLANGDWQLTYLLQDPGKRIRTPPPVFRPGSREGLWQHTCCEAFIGLDDTGYREFNLSPSGEWACYDFAAERARGPRTLPVTSPDIQCALTDDGWLLCATLAAVCLPAVPARIGLCAVLEGYDDHLAYHALRHPRDQADFHHPDGHPSWPHAED